MIFVQNIHFLSTLPNQMRQVYLVYVSIKDCQKRHQKEFHRNGTVSGSGFVDRLRKLDGVKSIVPTNASKYKANEIRFYELPGASVFCVAETFLNHKMGPKENIYVSEYFGRYKIICQRNLRETSIRSTSIQEKRC